MHRPLKPTAKLLLFVAALAFLLNTLWFVKTNSVTFTRSKAMRAHCRVNLKLIAHEKDAWRSASGAASSSVPTWTNLIGASEYLPTQPVCKAGGTYSINRLDQKPTCSSPGHTF